MMKLSKCAGFAFLFTTLVWVSGCIGLNSEHPAIGTYMLEVVRPDHGVRDAAADKLMVDTVEVLAPFDTQNLILRENDVTFTSSYYNRLILLPSENFRNALYSWFSDSGLFGEVVIDELGGASHRMVVTVQDFYGDLQANEAVLRMNMSLIDRTNMNVRRVISNRTYEQRAPVADFTAEDLVRAYNEALAAICTACEADLAEALKQTSD